AGARDRAGRGGPVRGLAARRGGRLRGAALVTGLGVPKPAENRRVPLRVEERPPWLRARYRATPELDAMRKLVAEQRLHTVCFSAACPNLGECWGRGTATFMIGGNHCTRRCGFCDVTTARPAPLDPPEPGCLPEAGAKP